MAVVQCDKGHYFDSEKYAKCPHCKRNLTKNPRRGISDVQTILETSCPDVADIALRKRLHIQLDDLVKNDRNEKTVGIFQTKMGYDPVVGWLVCVEGKEKGRDYRLHTGRNFIGRSLNSDIALVDDERITRENHCSVVFEPVRGEFWLARGKGDGVIVNGERLEDNRQLLADDTIEIGGCRFAFIPFCRRGRLW